jgi:hypothetical protein
MWIRFIRTTVLLTCSLARGVCTAEELPWIEVSANAKGFVRRPEGKPFHPWGVNYDHDENGRLIEDYWENEWEKVVGDFKEIRELGANVVRVHLQLAKFMDSSEKPSAKSLDQLSRLIKLAEDQQLYLDLTGLGCYHKKDVPAWYDALSEPDRWKVQAIFWESVASRAAGSPAIFCYDLMNEPVVPGGRRADGEWLGPPFAGKHFVQCISLDSAERARSDIAVAWIRELTTAIRRVDRRHLVTVGLVDWSLDRPGLTSGFVPEKIVGELDFLCVHIYPYVGKFKETRETLKAFNVGKPVVVEETFPLQCTPKQLETFIVDSKDEAAGWISFYWGKPPEELRKSWDIGDLLMLKWLECFIELSKAQTATP